jgi:hypothetical protein
MVSQPGRELILVAADRDPVDADRGTTMIDECPARVVQSSTCHWTLGRL